MEKEEKRVDAINSNHVTFRLKKYLSYPARARRARALGLLLADGAPTVGRRKTFFDIFFGVVPMGQL